MTGFEIAGAVLAVLPLLVSAAEHYEDAYRPFLRLRKFDAEVRRFQQQLNTQRTIFRTECELLLAQAGGEDDRATKMLQDPAHPSWQDVNVDNALLEVLGESEDACIEIMRMIAMTLTPIETEGKTLETLVQAHEHKEVARPIFLYLDVGP